jgi:hypothetical protein
MGLTATIVEVRLVERARKEIGELIDTRSDFLSSGAAADYADYRYRAGEIAGLTTALNMMGEILKSMGDSRS